MKFLVLNIFGSSRINLSISAFLEAASTGSGIRDAGSWISAEIGWSWVFRALISARRLLTMASNSSWSYVPRTGRSDTTGKLSFSKFCGQFPGYNNNFSGFRGQNRQGLRLFTRNCTGIFWCGVNLRSHSCNRQVFLFLTQPISSFNILRSPA